MVAKTKPKGLPKTGGRKAGTPNKATATLREAAQVYTRQALNVLVAVATDAGAPHAARVSAAVALLDRGHGRPGIVEGDQPDVPGGLTPEMLQKMDAHYEAVMVNVERQRITFKARSERIRLAASHGATSGTAK